MINFTNRFHGHGSLRFVYKNGQSVRSHFINLKYITNPSRKYSRISVVVSKKIIKSAVKRNRIRRRIYEIIRPLIDDFNNINDIVFIVLSSEILTMPSNELSKNIKDLLKEANVIN